MLQRAEDEYRLMFRKPESVPEYWTAIRFEIDVGKFDVAAPPPETASGEGIRPQIPTKERVKIEEAQGLATFLRLRWPGSPVVGAPRAGKGR